MTPETVLVVGGGIAGLALAYDLERLGVDVTLAEAERRLGGLIATFREDDFLLDGGPDAFLAAKPHARALCEELGLAPELIPTNPDERRVYVLRGGKLHALPDGMRLTVPTRIGPLLSSDLFTVSGKLRMLLERFVPARRGKEEESIADFIRRRFGAEALGRVGEPLLAGIHCGDAERLSMDVLFPRIVGLEKKYGSVTRGMVASGGRGNEAAFLSLRDGMGRLVEALGSRIPESRVRLGARLTALQKAERGYVASLSSGETIRARAIVLALPIRASEKLLEPLAPAAARALGGIATVGTAVVFHAFRRENVVHPLDGYGFVVPRAEPNRLLAATFVSTKFPGRAPDSHVLIRTFLGGLRDPKVLEMDDDSLQALASTELERALGPLGAPVFFRVVRWPDRTPQVELGHREKLRSFREALRELPGLWVLGSGLEGVGIPDSIAAARDAAREVCGYVEESRNPETGTAGGGAD